MGDFVSARVDAWEAAVAISTRTAQRYRQLVKNQIRPHLGSLALQALKPLDVESWHNTLRNGGLAARTIGHAHRVLSKALRDAERNGLIVRNVCKVQGAPKVIESEMAIVRDVPSLCDNLHGSRLYVPAVVALFTSARLSEILALRWKHIDLDGKILSVREALEGTKAHGIRASDRSQGRAARHQPARYSG